MGLFNVADSSRIKLDYYIHDLWRADFTCEN